MLSLNQLMYLSFSWRYPYFFTPRGFKKSPRRHFLPTINRLRLKISLQVDCGMLSSDKLINLSFSWRNPCFFTPRDFKKSPRRHFLPSINRLRLKISLQVDCGMLSSDQLMYLSFSWRYPCFFTPRGFKKSPRRHFLPSINRLRLKIWLQGDCGMPSSIQFRYQGFS